MKGKMKDKQASVEDKGLNFIVKCWKRRKRKGVVREDGALTETECSVVKAHARSHKSCTDFSTRVIIILIKLYGFKVMKVFH